MEDYKFEDIIRVVKRENNKNRKFLFLNLLQGKYVPCNPRKTLELFETLGKKLAKKYEGMQVCLIGFAETATAIAATVASCFNQQVYFLHTTREEMEKKYLVTEFQEEHSHAKKHCLYCKEKEWLKKSDVLILVDDEFTTGKTVCNLIKNLREKQWLKKDCKIVAASLINCMNEEHLQRFKKEKIECEYLIHRKDDWEKIDWNGFDFREDEEEKLALKKSDCENLREKKRNVEYDTRKWSLEDEKKDNQNVCGNKQRLQNSEIVMIEKEMVPLNKGARADIIKIKGRKNPRMGVFQLEYQNACEKLAVDMIEKLRIEEKKTEEILLLGTEEYMYPVIYAADKIQAMYPEKHCYVHATSRSPIVAFRQETYPIYSREEVVSFYEKDRNVFLYNLRKYDCVIVLTDAENKMEDAAYSMERVMKKYGNDNWRLVQWV